MQLSLFKLAWPIFCELLLMASVGFVNVFILSKYDNAAAAAVEATTQVIWNFFLLFVITASGTSVLVAQNVGAKQPEAVNKVASISLLLNTFMGFSASAFLLVFGKRILQFAGISQDLFDYSYTYLVIVGGFLFLDALLLSADAILKGFGKTKRCLFNTTCMNLVNLAVSLVLGLGLLGIAPMGVKGVAIAAVLGKLTAVLLALGYIFKNMLKINIFKYWLHVPLAELKKLLQIGFPSAMENLSYCLSQTVLMSIIIVNLGSEAYIARTYAWSVIKLFMLFSLAIGQANVIMIGQLVGAKKFAEADKAGMKNFLIAFSAAWGIGLILLLFREQFMEIFTHEASIVTLGMTVFAIDAFLEPGRTFNVVLINGLRGAGDVNFPVIIAIFSMWSIIVGLGYYIGVYLGFGLAGIWVALLIDEWLRGLCMLWRWKSGIWQKKVLV